MSIHNCPGGVGRHRNVEFHFKLSRKSCCSSSFWCGLFCHIFLCMFYFSCFLSYCFSDLMPSYLFSRGCPLWLPHPAHILPACLCPFLQISQLSFLFLFLILYSFLCITCFLLCGVGDKFSPHWTWAASSFLWHGIGEVTEGPEGMTTFSNVVWFSLIISIVFYLLT